MNRSQVRKHYCVPLAGYRHLYRSLLKYFHMSGADALALLYPLYIGNLDTCQYEGVPLPMIELTKDGFSALTEPYARPYHTEIQLYRSMIGLLCNINREATIELTRSAIKHFQLLINSLEYRFETTYNCTIDDPKTTYSDCWSRLTVRDNEPLTVFKPAIYMGRSKSTF